MPSRELPWHETHLPELRKNPSHSSPYQVHYLNYKNFQPDTSCVIRMLNHSDRHKPKAWPKSFVKQASYFNQQEGDHKKNIFSTRGLGFIFITVYVLSAYAEDKNLKIKNLTMNACKVEASIKFLPQMRSPVESRPILGHIEREKNNGLQKQPGQSHIEIKSIPKTRHRQGKEHSA